MITKLKENLKKATLFLTLLTIGLFIFLSLFSYNKNDNSLFSYNSLNLENHNYFGVLGSIISSSLLDIFGKVSYLIPIFFIFHSLRIIFNEKINWYNFFSLPFLLIASCLILEIIPENYFNLFLNGGLLGRGLENYHNYFLKDFEYKIYILVAIIILNILFLLFSFNLNISKISFFANFFF